MPVMTPGMSPVMAVMTPRVVMPAPVPSKMRPAVMMMSAKVPSAMVAAEIHVPAVMTSTMMTTAVVAATMMTATVVTSTMMPAAVAGERHVGHGKSAHGQRRNTDNPGFHRLLSSTHFHETILCMGIKRERRIWIEFPENYFSPMKIRSDETE